MRISHSAHRRWFGLLTIVTLTAASSARPAQALLTYNIIETAGGDLVVEGTGSLNLGSRILSVGCSPSFLFQTTLFGLCTGNLGIPANTYSISGPLFPLPIPTTLSPIFGSTSSGLPTLLQRFSTGEGRFSIPNSYISGSPINSTTTFSNTTFNDIGITSFGLVGTWTLQDGVGDQIQLRLTPVPVPGPLPLVGVGAAFGFSRKLRRQIATNGRTESKA